MKPASLPSVPASTICASVLSRRRFLANSLLASAAANLGGAAGPSVQAAPASDADDIFRKNSARKRRDAAYRLRQDAAEAHLRTPLVDHLDNHDEELHPNFIGNYSKGLPHNELGEVDPSAYHALLRALATRHPRDFEAIPLGAPAGHARKLVNPQAGLAFDLEGADSHGLTQRPAPALCSPEAAGEMLENYWAALARDIPFSEYPSNPLIRIAAADLSRLPTFRGPKVNRRVTPETLFRGPHAGCLNGPYISQFLWLTPPFGAVYVHTKVRTTRRGLNFMTRFEDWLAIQRGHQPREVAAYDDTRRYLRNARDLGEWVHIDVLYQAYFQALLILLAGPSSDSASSGLAAPLNPGNPYLQSRNQDGFGTFGPPHIAALLAEVSSRALKTVWFQKWFVHRRLRPEAYAGRVHLHLSEAADYPLDWNSLAPSPALTALKELNRTWLLPMAYPEGSPLHPAYGAGHATVAGACVTILKAWFDENFVLPNPVQATPDGRALVPYSGPPLTLGGELNKLANNVAIGRNLAGVHWRSDATESLKLGEAVAISILRDQKATYNEPFNGFTFTRFDGSRITV